MAVPTISEIGLDNYFFTDMKLSEDATLTASLRMFIDLDLINCYRINYETLCRWLLSVRKNYRNVRYHNWRHAFTVTQTMFSLIKNGGLRDVLSDLECLALMVGCLSHDLDHRGTTNNYQVMSESPLAQLYSTSTMEHHHFDQCIMILSSKGNEIFMNLNAEEYSQIMRLLEHAILATDLALYFKFRGEFFSLVEEGHDDWTDDDHRDLLRGMMMTASDVSAIAKPWHVQKEVAQLIFGEFFEQGDLERQQFNTTPEDMMNREKLHLLPKMQVGFVDSICMPVYEALAKTSEKLTPLLNGCKENRDHWQTIAEECNQPMIEKKEEASSDEKDIDESEAMSSSTTMLQPSNKD